MKRTVLLVALLAAAASSPHLRASAGAGAGQDAQAPPQTAAGISAEAMAQIEALIAEKESRSPVMQKIDSQLIYEIRMQGGATAAPGVQRVETDIPYAADGHAVVDVKANLSGGLTAALAALGAEVLSSSAETSSLRIHIAISSVEAVAALPAVIFVQPRQDAMTSGHIPPQARPGLRRRSAAVARYLAGAVAVSDQQPSIVSAPTGVGSRSSEGDVAHLAVAARAAFGVNGTGVKIGVLSDGVTNLAASQALGDLGPVTVLPGQAGTGDEGTAMLEIVHDLAPGAQLYFATAFGGIASFANNIRALRAAGCDIIVDDVFYFVETPFQDGQAPGVISTTNGGVVVQAVKDVTASGALYFSSAGNSGNVNDGTGGTWEGDFVDGGAITVFGTPYRIHSFNGQNSNLLTLSGGTAPISLFWSDPLGGSSNDYDLFRLNLAGTGVAAAGTNVQNGTQDPIEQISQSTANPRIIIVKKAAAQPRFLHLETNRGRLSIPTQGTTHGHAAVDSEGAYGVAATPAAAAFPNPFSAANLVETFSSDGPRRIFYDGAGVPITPGNFLADTAGGKVLQKPDITAADGVSVTGVGGFPSPFFGTSAAAPHAAAIAGLLKSAVPALTGAQARAALTASAIDIEAPGLDRDSGVGIIMANSALTSAGAVGTAALFIESLQVSDNPGNGNGQAEAGEGARLAIPLANYGAAGATSLSATLASLTPGITVTQPAGTAYPDLAVSASGLHVSPLLFTVASDFPCPRPATFELTVNYAGGPSPRVFTFDVPIGPGPFTTNTTLNLVAPPSSAGVSTTTGVQHFRLFRDGVASTCGVQKLFPGLAANAPPPAATQRQFAAYSFATCANSAPSCATVTLQGTNAINLFAAAYTPSFDPANISLNYKADAGASSALRTFSFDLPGGAQSFAVNVHDVPQGLAAPTGIAYSLTVSGACLGACDPPNQVPVAKAKDVTVFADNTCGAAASIDDGSSDADGDTLTFTQSPAGPYPLGSTPVLLTVVDPKGATSQASATVTVKDNTAPDITCPAPIVVPASPGACSAPVTFTPTATDACSPPVSLVSTPASGSIFAVGTTTVTSTASDAAGNAASCPIAVTVVDDQPPAVSHVFAWPPILKSKNHKLVDVKVFYNLADNCGASCSLSVTSTELPKPRGKGKKEKEDGEGGKGKGKNDPDWIVIDAQHVRLRAETDSNSLGRIYTITVTCKDTAGNSTVKVSKVLVLHDQGDH